MSSCLPPLRSTVPRSVLPALTVLAVVATIVTGTALVMAWGNLYNADAFLTAATGGTGDNSTEGIPGMVGPALVYVKVGACASAVAVLSLVWRMCWTWRAGLSSSGDLTRG